MSRLVYLQSVSALQLTFLECVCTGLDGKETMRNAVVAAVEAANKTKEMNARAGRSAYVPQSIAQGIDDPGALAVASWMGAIEAALFGSVDSRTSEGRA